MPVRDTGAGDPDRRWWTGERSGMADLQTTWSEAELLADEPGLEPLVVAGYRCHGGFDDQGTYRSPRTRFRVAAIEAWQARHRRDLGTELLDVPLATWPAPYPNLAQSRYLLSEGVRQPIVTTLTRIGTVEGFGALIRAVCVPDRQRFFAEPIEGTAIEHLDRGLFEAHARDEAGWGETAGHKHMWFAVRDLAFEGPPTEDETAEMLRRMGLGRGAAAPDPGVVARQMLEARRFEDLDLGLEMMIQRMIDILLIEISAHHVFAWAEALLADTDLVAGDGEPARIVSYIRQDEAPHVEYLRTALTEMRDRTFVTTDGGRRPGAEVIGTLWSEGLTRSLGERRRLQQEATVAEVTRAVEGHPRRADILARFHELGDGQPAAVAAAREAS